MIQRSLLLVAGLLFSLSALANGLFSPTVETDDPCKPADPGFGIYAPWNPNLAMGRILMPQQGGLTPSGEFDVLIHFHGSDAIRKALIPVARGVFLVGIDLGLGSAAYQGAFSRPEAFPQLLDSIERAVAEHSGDGRARIRKIALSGWSAGYGAIRAILRQEASQRIDSLILLDGLHADYDLSDISGLQADQLSPFLHFARQAARQKRFMFVSHSKIVPPGYASTTETAHYLVNKLGGRISPSPAQDSPHLARYEQAAIGNFLMRGYCGEDKADHCAEIGLITGMVSRLEKRWQTPAAKGVNPDLAQDRANLFSLVMRHYK